MELDTILRGDQTLLYMERYVDEGTKTYSPFAARSEVAAQYQPSSDRFSFELISVFAPCDKISVFQAEPPKALLDFYVRKKEIRFLVHPETWASADVDHLDELRALRRAEPIQAAPTASTRTVLATHLPGNTPSHFIKLHYPKRISRFNRRLRRKNISNSIEVTRDLKHVANEKFAYLPDVLGFTYGSSEESWGFLVRERTPHPFREGRFLIPFFSLYGGDLKDAQHRPLLVQLIEHLGVEPQSFVIDEIMTPVLECWTQIARERGILFESHAQNILLEIDRDFRPLRVVHRDFDVWVDIKVRTERGLGSSFRGINIGTDTHYPREQHYSLVYDHFIGRELFDFLAGILTRFYGGREDEIRKRVIKAFHLHFPESHLLFPADTTYYFSNEILPGNEVKLINTQQPPRWR